MLSVLNVGGEGLTRDDSVVVADESKAMERITNAVGWNAILRVCATRTGDDMVQAMFHMLERPQSTIDAYGTWKTKATNTFADMGSAVLCEKLGYHARLDKEAKKYVAVRPPSPATEHLEAATTRQRGKPYAIHVDGKECLVAIHANSFPYHVSNEVCHDVLWSEHRLPADAIIPQIEAVLGGQPFVWYENVEARKSLPMVFHVHIFSKAPLKPSPVSDVDSGTSTGKDTPATNVSSS